MITMRKQTRVNASFIASHHKLLEKTGRLRVAKQLLAILKDWFGAKNMQNMTLLDIGCSNGVITDFLANSVKKATGIDVDAQAVFDAKQGHSKKNLEFIVASATKLPFAQNTHDIVICNQVYSYVDDPKKLMAEIYKVLKKDGVCIFTGDNLLRVVEPLYNIPLLRLLPKWAAILLLKTLGHKKIYIGSYKTYWGIKNLCRRFIVYDYTLKIIKNPRNFNYKNLEKNAMVANLLPNWLLKLLEPFFPSFVFLLVKELDPTIRSNNT